MCGPCCSTPMKPQKTCPECGTEMDDVALGFDSRNDFVFGWRCPKCGHEEAVQYG